MIPKTDVHLELSDPEDLEAIWCEFVPEEHGWARLKLGFETGSRPVTQTLAIALSNAYDPIPDLIRLAESGVRLAFPCEIEIESEGPISVLSLKPIGAEGLALFEVRNWYGAVIFMAAIVNPRQFGYELALSIAEILLSPQHATFWRFHWDGTYGCQFTDQYHAHPWFSSVLEDFTDLQERRVAARSW